MNEQERAITMQCPQPLPLYLKEFPGFPTLDVELPAEFGDDSNGYHDLSPCFVAETLGLLLWVNHPDPAERPDELAADALRFCLCDIAPQRQYPHESRAVLVETDHWPDVLAAIEGRRRFNPQRPAGIRAGDIITVPAKGRED